MKIKELNLTTVEVDSNTRGRHVVGRIARILLAVAAVFAGSPDRVMASAITDNQTRVLPFPNQPVSTIPSNGDVNPYGVAFVPEGFPTGGTLNPGDLLVSNFNNSTNTQGTGTTIIDISSAGQTTVFFRVPLVSASVPA
jgi:hypothetical protein